MKTKIIALSLLVAGGCAAVSFANAPAGNGNTRGNSRGACDPANCPMVCGGTGPGAALGVCDGTGQGARLQNGAGKAGKGRGNPNSIGTPLRDGSGKATAPGKGAKDGTGPRANCPVPPKS